MVYKLHHMVIYLISSIFPSNQDILNQNVHMHYVIPTPLEYIFHICITRLHTANRYKYKICFLLRKRLKI